MRPHIRFILILLLTNLLIFNPVTRPFGAFLITLVLPGWGWANLLLSSSLWLAQFVLTLGFSYLITILVTLLFHYLPGPIVTGFLLTALNVIALLPLLISVLVRPSTSTFVTDRKDYWLPNTPISIAFVIVLILTALLLRTVNLDYSEFQGDEALAMITAADALTGHEDALFLRSKGPAEVLIPAAMWQLNDLTSELFARIPFALAGLAAIATFYLMARAFFSGRASLYGTAFFAANGFMLGFSRIVQYQMLVIWMSILAVWTLWLWRQSGRVRWAFVSGLFAGVGLLAHYDAILILPVLGWMIVYRDDSKAQSEAPPESRSRRLNLAFLCRPLRMIITPALTWLLAYAAVVSSFFIPYLQDPQVSGTGQYLGDRIGEGLLKNNLAAFFHFNSFYSSFYYILIVSLLAVGFIAWVLQQTPWSRVWGPILAIISLVGLSLFPNLLGIWIILPFALIFLAALFSNQLSSPQRLALIWFCVPFLGYNFGVARPLTHIYTVGPGLALLAGWTMNQLPVKPTLITALNLGLLLLFSGYLWNAFVRTDLEFFQDYPLSNLAFYWTPYDEPPETGFFGFTHKTGWKAIGALYTDGVLQGDYDSNEEEDVTSWYTRHAIRACDPGAEYYFIADDLIDEMPLPEDLLANQYQTVAQTMLPNSKSLTILQQQPIRYEMGTIDIAQLAKKFDETAQPINFSRTPQWQVNDGTNFGGQIQLLGYSLNSQRAYPGGRILLTLFWQALAPLDQSYKVFVQFDSERKFAQADSIPVCARFPTNLWRPGQIITDHHALHLSPETPLESIRLDIGLYVPEDGRRLDILDSAGNPAGVNLTLTEIEIRAR